MSEIQADDAGVMQFNESIAPALSDNAATTSDPEQQADNDPMAALNAYFGREDAQMGTDADPDRDNDDTAADNDDDADDNSSSAKVDQAAATDAKQQAKPSTTPDSTDTAAAEGEGAATAEADGFDAINAKPEFLDADGLKAKFPRNSSKELIAEAARYSDLAQKGYEVVEKLGGEHYLPSMELISAGLQSGEPQKIFEGIMGAASAEGLVQVLADSMHLVLIQGSNFAKNPDIAEFGETLNKLADAALSQRFGPGVTAESLSKLVELQEAGWLEKIEKWKTDEWVDADEAQELLEAAKIDPKLKEALAEKERLAAELAARNAQMKEAQAVREQAAEGTFDETIQTNIDKVLEGIVWAKSPLRDIAGDTAEVKAEKAFLRGHLRHEAASAFMALPDRAKLLTDFRLGKGKTGQFGRDMAAAVNSSILSIREQNATAERFLAKLYGTGRNAQLLAAQKGNGRSSSSNGQSQASVNNPTQPSVGQEAPRSGAFRSNADIFEEMEKKMSALA